MFDGGQYPGIAGSVQGLGGFGADAQSQGAALQPGAQQHTQQNQLGMNPAQFAAMSQMGPDLSSAAGNGLTPAMLAMLQQTQQQGGASGSRWPAGQSFNPSMFNQTAQQAAPSHSGAPGYASQPAYNFGALQGGGGGLSSEAGAGAMFGQGAQNSSMQYSQFAGASAMPQTSGAIEPNALMNGLNGFAETSTDGAGSSYGSMQHAGSAAANAGMQPFMYASASSPGASDVGEFKKPGTSQGGRRSRGTPTSTPGPKFGPPGAHQGSSPGHAVPHAGGIQAFARDRSRSHTRSPSVSGAQLPQQPGHRPPGTPLQTQQPHPSAAGTPRGAHASQPQMAMPSFPPGWQPAMPPAQQQQMMSQAMQLSKQRANQGQAMSPAQALQQMGFVFVKAALLPPQAQEALVAGGAVISINEARALGFLPQHGQAHAGQGAGAGQAPAAHSPHPSSLNPQAQQQFMMQQQQHARQQSQQPQQQQQYPSHAPSTPQQQAGMPPPQVFRPSPGAHAASPAHGPQSPSAGAGGMSAPNGSARVRQGTNPPRPQSRSSARGGSRPPTTDGLSGSNPFAPSDMSESASRRPSSALALDGAPPGPSRSFSVASADGVSGGPPDALATIEQQAQAQAAQLRAHRFSVASLPPSQGGPLPKFTKSGFAVADYNSRVTPLPPLPDGDEVPEEDAKALEKLWQPLTKEEEGHLAVIMQRDHDYTQMINTHGHRSLNALRARADELRPAPHNLHWWERPDVADDPHYINKAYEALHVLLPQQKRHEQLRKGGRSAGTLASNLSAYEDRRLSRAAAGKVEDLVPIRLEIDYEAWRLRETFTWNATDAHVGLDSFAQTLCDDFALPHAGFVAAIKQSVQAQVQEHVAARALYVRRGEDADDARRGKLDAEEQQWWKRQRDSLADEASPASRKRALSAEAEDERATAKSESPVVVARPRAELRIDIRLDITVGAMNLVDRFEWDLGEDETTSPEQFAEVFAADLGLSGEFRTAIAHSIREQVDVHKRSLALLGYAFDGADVYDEELRTCFLPSVSGAARNEADADSHTPRLHQLSEADIDLLEKERERDARRKRRQTRGRRGINLPDREPQKTQRTPAVSGLQAANIAAMLASNGGEMAGGEWNGLVGPGGRSDRGAGISTRRAAAAATASIAPSLGLPDRDTPAPVPEAPQAAAKRARLESHAVHFVHPGGLGGLNEATGPSFVGANGGELHKHRPVAQSGAAVSASAQDTPQSHMSAKAAAAAAVAAKIRAEDVKTQHECFHDGQWHCSNCGIPGTLAPGRRKGPLGDKTLCGPCGKYYHRHRRIQNVHYTRDEGFHRGLYGHSKIPRPEHGDSTQPTSAADTPASGANGSSGARADKRRADREAGEGQHSSSDDDDDDDDEDDDDNDEAVDDKSKVVRNAHALQAGSLVSQPQSTRGNSPDLPFQQVGSPDEDSDSAESSPGSSRRPSASPSKNGVQARLSQTPAMHAGSPLKQEQGVAQDTHRVPSESPALAPSGAQQAPPVAPDWLSEAADSLRQQYPDDRFELLLRARPPAAASLPEVPGQTDWRVRCQDCPGKLYTPGPGESLDNFLIHLRNRLHRNNVAARLSLEQ